uniref:MLO-like protein n=1 Tax=Spongospora subterranea TaxID=70186 RepID=A0A0H5R9K4_9EUKA|eukprot:CRZ10476.1 hypothetical protein [Spongospora subterranea]
MSEADDDEADILHKAANTHEFIAVLTIMITLLMHVASIKLEQVLKRHKHLSEMLHHLYRELMVLGLISFGLFIIELHNWEALHYTKTTFESIHILIFLIAFGYTTFTALLMTLSVRISKFWDGIEQQHHSVYLENKAKFDTIRQSMDEMSFAGQFLHFPLYLRYFTLVEQISFHDLRLHFLHSNHLPPSFSFARYLRKCKSHVLLQFGDIHSTCWMSLVVLVILDMLQRNSIGITSENYIFTFWRITFAVLGTSLCVIPVSILFKTRSILSEILCHSEMIDFDPVAARYYIDHWGDDDDGSHESSLSYAYDDGENPQQPVVHFTSESALRRVARTFQIDHWGQTGSSPDVVLFPSASNQPHVEASELEPPRLARVQSVHNVEFSQMNLFWFNSHVFMLRLMQVCLFLVVCYFATLFQFHTYIFAGRYWAYPFALIPLGVLLTCFAWTVPIYTIIIHVGQLVDLDIVLEARRKASKPVLDMTAVSVTPSQLRRASTLMLLDNSDRLRLRVSMAIFGGRFQILLFWCILLQTVIVMLSYFESLSPHLFLPYVTPIIPSLFVIEMLAKFYAAGPKFFTRSAVVVFDLVVVVCAFFAAFLQLFVPRVSPVLTACVLLRIYQIMRVSRIGRIMRHQQECHFEAKIGESEIEEQMKRTKRRIIEAISAEPSFHKKAASYPETQFALGRSRTMPVSPQRVPMKSLRLNFEIADHIELPVRACVPDI